MHAQSDQACRGYNQTRSAQPASLWESLCYFGGTLCRAELHLHLRELPWRLDLLSGACHNDVQRRTPTRFDQPTPFICHFATVITM